MEGIGDRIKSIREKAGQSQAVFAQNIDVSRETLINYEKNKTQVPTQIIKLIAKLYNVSAIWIMGGQEIIKEGNINALLKELNIWNDIEALKNSVQSLKADMYDLKIELEKKNEELRQKDEAIEALFAELGKNLLALTQIEELRRKYNL